MHMAEKISTIAAKYLCICMTCMITSKKLFLHGQGIMTYKRPKLASDTVSMLAMIKCSDREDDATTFVRKGEGNECISHFFYLILLSSLVKFLLFIQSNFFSNPLCSLEIRSISFCE